MSMFDKVYSLVRVARGLPQARVENDELTQQRGGRYGEICANLYMQGRQALADEGAYFVVTNPTPGTKIDYGSAGTSASYDATKPMFLIKNNSQANGKRLYFDYLKILQIGGTAPASSTSVQFALIVDGASKIPATSGTLTAGTPVNVNMDDGTAPQGQLYYAVGALPVIPANSNAARIVGRGELKGAATANLDEYGLYSGGIDGPSYTSPRFCVPVAPIVLGPQQWLQVYIWLPSGATNPLSYEFEAAWYER